MSTPKLGDSITKKLTSGRLYLTLTGETGGYDLGNILDAKVETKMKRADLKKAQGGLLLPAGMLAMESGWEYTFTGNEHSDLIKQILYEASKVNDASQTLTAAPSGTASFTAKQGRYFQLGKYNVDTVVVTVSASTKTEGTDYSVDYVNGVVYIIPGGGIADAASVSVTFGYAALTQLSYAALAQLNITGTFEYSETDQFKTGPRELHTFTGQITSADLGDNNLSKENQWKVTALATSKPAIIVRKDSTP